MLIEEYFLYNVELHNEISFIQRKAKGSWLC